jgi:hypothetical protein
MNRDHRGGARPDRGREPGGIHAPGLRIDVDQYRAGTGHGDCLDGADEGERRRDHFVAGSDAGGERAAIAYTILGCCRLAGVDPAAYLTDVLPRLARRIRIADVAALMPASWKARQPAPAPSDPPRATTDAQPTDAN